MINIKKQLNQDSLHKEILSHVTSIAERLQMPAYIVGGYVRDILLGKETTDIDIMPNPNPKLDPIY